MSPGFAHDPAGRPFSALLLPAGASFHPRDSAGTMLRVHICKKPAIFFSHNSTHLVLLRTKQNPLPKPPNWRSLPRFFLFHYFLFILFSFCLEVEGTEKRRCYMALIRSAGCQFCAHTKSYLLPTISSIPREGTEGGNGREGRQGGACYKRNTVAMFFFRAA